MDIRLMSLRLKNFKGIKEYELPLNGDSAIIQAENGVGKTTLYDAFLWLLFGKDSANRADFSIKTLDANNNEIHGLDHEVEGEFLVDGHLLKFRKCYAEVWTKKRGESEKLLTGHETQHWVNDVPCSKGEYVNQIKTLLDEDMFRMITNPECFSASIDWKTRRDLLLEMSGDVSSTDVISSDAKLKDLGALLLDRTIDDLRKMNAEKIKMCNKALADIRPRIDENISGCLSAEEMEKKAAHATAITILTEENARIVAELASGNVVSVEENKCRGIIAGYTAAIDGRKAEIERAARMSFEEKRMSADIAQQRRKGLELKLASAKNQRDDAMREIEIHKKKIIELREVWQRENAVVFEMPAIDEYCKFCKQPLPEEMIDSQANKFRNIFAEDKKEKLENISAAGKKQASALAVEEDQLVMLELGVADLERDIDELPGTGAMEIPAYVPPNFSEDPFITDRTAQIAATQKQLDKLASSGQDAIRTESIARQTEIDCQIGAIRMQLAAIEESEKRQERIKELGNQERAIAAEIMNLEKVADLSDRFIKAKVRLLEDKINNMFNLVTFKMFRQQVNGGIEECCEPLINGVPYRDANLASKINAGLDIVNTISAHFKVYAPIFVDRAESINHPIDTKAQTIRLCVSKEKKFRIEYLCSEREAV